jgi:hypothetical protein
MSLITTLKHLEATSKIVADGGRELVDSMSNGQLKNQALLFAQCGPSHLCG